MKKTLEDFHHNDGNREVFQDFGLFFVESAIKMIRRITTDDTHSACTI